MRFLPESFDVVFGKMSVHVHPITALRRFALACVGTAASALFFHSFVSSGLVSRGDDFLRGGDTVEAGRYYHRALWWDRNSAVAVDRMAVSLSMGRRGDRAALRECVGVTSAFLAVHPSADEIRGDRGICLLRLGARQEARRDFVILARAPNGGRYAQLADLLGRPQVRGSARPVKRL